MLFIIVLKINLNDTVLIIQINLNYLTKLWIMVFINFALHPHQIKRPLILNRMRIKI
jgi:hypothetical protein